MGNSAVLDVGDISPGTGFIKGSADLGSNYVKMGQFTLSSPYVTGEQLTGPPGLRRVEVGTVTFTASAIPGDVTEVTVWDFDEGRSGFGYSDDFTIGSYVYVIDSEITPGTATIRTTGTAIPEPGGVALLIALGAAITGAWGSGGRRKDRFG